MSQQQPSLWDRVERRIPAFGERAVRAYAARSPRYHGEPPDHLYRHMAPNCREFARLYLRAARLGRDLGEDETQPFRERARTRAEEGLPVEDLLDGYFTMAEVLWDEITRAAEESGTPPPPEAAALLLRCQRIAAHAAVQTHRWEYQAAHTEEREAVRALVRALVAGEPAADPAHRSGRRLAPAYGVLALRLDEHPDELSGDAVGRRLAGRRKVHRLTEQLARALGEEALTALDPDGGLVLLPSHPDDAAAERQLAATRTALPALGEAAGAPVTAAYAHAVAAEAVPAAADQARRLLRLPSAAPGEVAALRDHLLAYHLDQDTEARPHLLALADQLRAHPELLATLESFYAHDFNRRHTAEALYIHPNTVDNRLTRVAALTGTDPRTTQGLLLFASALTLRR